MPRPKKLKMSSHQPPPGVGHTVRRATALPHNISDTEVGDITHVPYPEQPRSPTPLDDMKKTESMTSMNRQSSDSPNAVENAIVAGVASALHVPPSVLPHVPKKFTPASIAKYILSVLVSVALLSLTAMNYTTTRGIGASNDTTALVKTEEQLLSQFLMILVNSSRAP